jgi:hypothetical protein
VLLAAGRLGLHEGGLAMTGFTSAFASRLEAMLDWREALGYSRGTLSYPMLSFDRFCAEQSFRRDDPDPRAGHGLVPGRHARGVARPQGARAFGTCLRLVGEDAFVLPADWISPRVRNLPHLFTDAELTASFAATNRIAPCASSPLREYTIPVIFRLMLTCGLRPQEARQLRRGDVDTGSGLLTIERSSGTRTAASRSTRHWPACWHGSTASPS